jgi:hypothetical protein
MTSAAIANLLVVRVRTGSGRTKGFRVLSSDSEA